MKNFVILFLLILLAEKTSAAGRWDLQAHGFGRNYPIAAIVGAQAGYSHLLWGQEPTRPEDWQYGFVRPWLQAQTIGLNNRVNAEIEVFPVSILGFAAGSGSAWRGLKEYPDFDCQVIMCDGRVNRDYVRAVGLVGYKAFLLVFQNRLDRLYPSEGREYFEDSSTLIARGFDDRVRSRSSALVYRKDQRISFGLALTEQWLTSNGNRNELLSFFGQWQKGERRYLLSLGRFESSHQSPGFSGTLSFVHFFREGYR